jgi:cell division septation protein DedD
LLTVIEQATTPDTARLHRVQAGPFASREEADAAAAQVRGKLLLLTPVVIQKR